MNVNLAILNDKTQQRLSVGKLVAYRNTTILHAWIKATYRRIDIDALGFNRAALEYAAAHGAEEVYLYDPKARQTYVTYIAKLLKYGTRGAPDGYGGNQNLALDEWSVMPGQVKVAFVPDSATRVVTPQAEVIWNDPAPEPEEPVAAQFSLLGEAS